MTVKITTKYKNHYCVAKLEIVDICIILHMNILLSHSQGAKYPHGEL